MLRRRRPRTPVEALALVGAGVLLAVLLVPALSGVLDLVRAAAGLAILILPGLALGITRRPTTPLRRLDLLLAAAALSLACVAISGLVLNVLPAGLNQSSWLGVVAGLLLATAVLARSGLPRVERERWVSPKAAPAFAMVAALALVALALVIARVGVKQPSEPYSAVWVVPASEGMVEIGLDNREAATTTYRVDVTVEGSVGTTFPSITIAPGERWTTLVPEPDPGGPRMEVVVFVESRPGVVYRRVTLSAGVAEASAGT